MPDACTGEVGKILQRIIESKSFFGRLGLENKLIDPSIVKKQYRQLALAVHPDKCSAEIAKEAFQKLSEAFDVLSTESGQKSHLAELGIQQHRHVRKRKAQQQSTNRWWNTSTWDEFDRRFRHREAAETALRKEFEEAIKAKLSAKRIRSQVLLAEQSAEHCDRAAGYPESDLWPPQSRLQFDSSAASSSEGVGRPELDQAACALTRLLELLTHLRTVHKYCLYCGCVFDSFEDLERNCPGFTEEEHISAGTFAARTSGETAIELASQVEVYGEDPLDAFMAGMHNEVQKDLKNSLNATKKRLQPAKGWSFEQQAQQNKNERKRMKRGR